MLIMACNRTASAVEDIIIDPTEFPSGCNLHWPAKPFRMTTETEADRKYINMIAGFWVGKEYPIEAGQLVSGISNV